jgi:prepilin-type N-terminal cleavage/methylation domain-containing protein
MMGLKYKKIQEKILNEKGTSLIEVLVAMVILGIGFSVVMKSIFSADVIFRTQYQGRLEVQTLVSESEKLRMWGGLRSLSDSVWVYDYEGAGYEFDEIKSNSLRLNLTVMDSTKLEELAEEEGWDSQKRTSMMLRPQEAKLELFRYEVKTESWTKRREMFFFIPELKKRPEEYFPKYEEDRFE